jgi:hypothetical protein
VQLTVSIFNSAGEVVDVPYQGGAESVPVGLTLSGTLLVEGTSTFQVDLGTVLVDGQSALAWSGLNANGQMVGSGTYYIQAKYTNSFGQITTYTKSVQVLAAATGEGVSIFNSAGERVWWSALPAGGVGTGSFSLSPSPLVLAYDPSTGTLLQPLVIQMTGGGAVTWNGQSLSGQPVASGSYTVQIVSGEPGGSLTVTSKPLVVMATAQGGPSAIVHVAPNPWQSGPLLVAYTPYPGYQGACLLYTLSGGLVGAGVDASGSGRIFLDPAGLAQGIYLLEFRQQEGASAVVHSLTKIAVIR